MSLAVVCVNMSFGHNLSKISKFVFYFGISPFSFNKNTNKYECSIHTLIYTLSYFLLISITIIYLFASYLSDGIRHFLRFQTTFTSLTLLLQSTIMIMFFTTTINLMVKRQKHANFLNNLIELDSTLLKSNIKTNSDDLLTLHKQHIFIAVYYSTVIVIDLIININEMQIFRHLLWSSLQILQNVSLAMVGYYIRCFAIILHHRCNPIFEYLDFIGNELLYTQYYHECLAKVMKGFELFDEVMDLKNQLSSIYGVQIFLNSAFDFIMLTISVYGILCYQTQNTFILYYFVMYNLPHAIHCILLVLALDTLADQVNTTRRNILKLHKILMFFYLG